MSSEKPFIHIFKTPNSYYLYDVNTNTIIKTNKDLCVILYDSPNDYIDHFPYEPGALLIKKMKKDGFLSSKRIDEIVHPMDETLTYYLGRRISSITLQVTQNCNLRCSYCAYSGKYENRTHSNKIMSLNTAKKGIDFLIDHSADCQKINIGFYGGEPLLEFEMIKNCIEYTKKKAEGKKVDFHITINGTLLNQRIIEFFIKHDVLLAISLDGPRELHDKNRRYAANNCGTFDTVFKNLQIIKEKYPDYLNKVIFNMVLDPETDFDCLVNFVAYEDLLSESPLLFSLISDKYSKNGINIPEEFITKVNYETFKVLLNKIGKLDIKFVSKIALRQYEASKVIVETMGKTYQGLPHKAHPSGPCTTGAQRLFMDVNGGFYPCERVSENSDIMKIGDVDRGFDIEKVRRLLNIGRLTESNCKNCWAFRYCSICAADADNLCDLSEDKKNNKCNKVRKSTEDFFANYCTLKELGNYSYDKLNVAEYL